MRYSEVPEEKRALIIERHKRGDSFSKIGRDLGVDRRIVARIAREDEEQQAGQVAVRRTELARVFHEHQDALKEVARTILELTASPLLRGNLLPVETKIEPMLIRRPEDEPRQFYGHLPNMSEAEESQIELKEAVARRLSSLRWKAAIQGLKEHIPVLEVDIRKWEEAASEYRDSWDQLKQRAISEGVPSEQIEQSARRALQQMPETDREDWLPSFREPAATNDKIEGFTRVLLQKPSNRRLLKMFSQRLNELDTAYEKLEETLGTPQLDNALVRGHCQYCPVP
jgi:hypothetical protein